MPAGVLAGLQLWPCHGQSGVLGAARKRREVKEIKESSHLAGLDCLLQHAEATDSTKVPPSKKQLRQSNLLSQQVSTGHKDRKERERTLPEGSSTT